MTLPHLPWNETSRTEHLAALGALPEAVHVFDRSSVEAINAALAARRPLLVRGEPGTGKSQLARAAAARMKRPFLSMVIDARTEARDLFWSFDAVSRLAQAQIQQALGVASAEEARANLKEERFLSPGPLWWAFDWETAGKQAKKAGAPLFVPPDGWTHRDGVVVLIDEIDKADSSVPNGLLEALGQGQFSCPGGGIVEWNQSSAPPLIVITTNEERALPDPFLRRCLVLQLSFPEDRAELVDVLEERGRAHFPEMAEAVRTRAAELLVEDRAAVRNQGLMPPGGAEYLDLLRALAELGKNKKEQLELVERLSQFTYKKHPPEPRW